MFLLEAVLMPGENTYTGIPIADTLALHSNSYEINFQSEVTYSE